MAEKKSKPTVRERTQSSAKEKPRRLKKASSKISAPFRRARKFGAKEYHPVKLPDNKAGRILGKRGRLVPKYFRESWTEIKLVTWPNRRETYRLTIAVLIFSVIFSTIVALLDYGLDKIFRGLIVK